MSRMVAAVLGKDKIISATEELHNKPFKLGLIVVSDDWGEKNKVSRWHAKEAIQETKVAAPVQQKQENDFPVEGQGVEENDFDIPDDIM